MKIEISGLVIVLTAIFVTLKLTNTIDWSWFWVLSPLWIMLLLVFIILLICGIIARVLWKKMEKSDEE